MYKGNIFVHKKTRKSGGKGTGQKSGQDSYSQKNLNAISSTNGKNFVKTQEVAIKHINLGNMEQQGYDESQIDKVNQFV